MYDIWVTTGSKITVTITADGIMGGGLGWVNDEGGGGRRREGGRGKGGDNRSWTIGQTAGRGEKKEEMAEFRAKEREGKEIGQRRQRATKKRGQERTRHSGIGGGAWGGLKDWGIGGLGDWGC